MLQLLLKTLVENVHVKVGRIKEHIISWKKFYAKETLSHVNHDVPALRRNKCLLGWVGKVCSIQTKNVMEKEESLEK